MPPFKDENILIIAPGSQTTLAQLGLPESFTPAQHKFRSRVFLNEDGKTFDPHKITKKKPEESTDGGDVEMTGTEAVEDVYVENPDDEEGAIWPLKGTSNSLRKCTVTDCYRGTDCSPRSILCASSIYTFNAIPTIAYSCYAYCATLLDGERSREYYDLHF